MKHLTTMLLALGLALGAAGQNVEVLMNDGTFHKFNADYLSEISFKDVPLETPPVEFKTISVEPYTGGNVSVTLKTENDNVICVADLYGSKDAIYMQPGVYEYSASNDPYTLDSNPTYTSLTVDGEGKTITGGKITVSLEERVYTFEVEYALEGGGTFRGKWSGELPAYTKWLEATMTGASYNENPQAPGTFYVKMNDAPDYKYEMALVFVAEADAKELPAGTYTYSDVPTPGTLLSSSKVSTYFIPYDSYSIAPGSNVVVEKNGEDYTITMHLNLSDGREAEFTYSGAITGTPTFEDVPEPVVYKIDSVNPYGQGNTAIVFTDASDDKQQIQLDCYGSANAVYFEPGEYVVGATDGFKIATGNFTFFSQDGEQTAITSGTLDVSLAGDVYTFNFTGKLENGNDIVMTCTGKLPKFGPVISATMTSASYNANPQAPGTFYVKMNDDSWDYEMALVFVAEADAKELPAGTYTYSETGIAGTLSSKSYVDTFRPSTNNKLKEGSQAVVMKTDDNYTLVMTLQFEDGRIANFTYAGKISGTPAFE